MRDIAAHKLSHQKNRNMIYLDSRDLITLAEKKSKEYSDEFIKLLRINSSNLIYSMHNIMECGASYVVGGVESTSMKTLNFLEDIPHKYIAEAKVPLLELSEAVSAFREGREYQKIDTPFVARFDYVLFPFNKPPTAIYLKYSLSQIIFELANENENLFKGYSEFAETLRKNLNNDRTLKNFKDHKSNFSRTLKRDLKLYKISFREDEGDELAEWIWKDINRCPGYRLGYEVYHKLLKNIGDSGQESDFPDFAHIYCAPYVDIITLDNRMRGYIEQVDKSINSNYFSKVRKNLDGVNVALQQSVS